ncbi:RimK family alpha-L-glutamate ligase [Streptomyces pathocidini]|uniref:RimK family alpha-L-glutamate ligase n=2 Tax=Streptomyces pathocidini TaxID=1650571 RepID=A0ABW7USK3_9ACTN
MPPISSAPSPGSPYARIALVTCKSGPGVSTDPDLAALRDAVAAAGAEVTVAEWDDPAVDWAGFDLALIRSTWDYTWRTGEFLAWVERCAAATTLANPGPVVSWNADKRYLGDLAQAGVPAVPTSYSAPGSRVEDLPLPDDREYVIKPASGAGARYAARYRPEDRAVALRHVERMHAEGLTAMVQPFMSRIDTRGERALVFLAGRFLHAIRKNAVLSPGTAYDARKIAHPGKRPYEPTATELAVAERALAAVPGTPDLLYARVDLVEDDQGAPRVMELELIEPQLFLGPHPESLPTVAKAVVAAARTAQASRRPVVG